MTSHWSCDPLHRCCRFVNSETIREYVSPDQLLTQFGGTDPWEFDYEREREVMLGQLQSVLQRDQGEREEREREEREREERENSQMQSTEVRKKAGIGAFVMLS